MTECWAVMKAEDVYTALLEGGAAIGPGWRAEMEAAVADRTFRYSAAVFPNAVWRRGRVFLRCPSCAKWRTRLLRPAGGCLADVQMLLGAVVPESAGELQGRGAVDWRTRNALVLAPHVRIHGD